VAEIRNGPEEPDRENRPETTPSDDTGAADPSRLPDDELFKAADYGDGSDQAFLRRLWRDLYGGEPAAGA
jgi:hypothetical protein